MPVFERESLSNSDILKASRTWPPYARGLIKSMLATESHLQSSANAYWNEHQNRMAKIQKAKHFRKLALDDDERTRYDEEIAAEQDAIAEGNKARDLLNSQLLGIRIEGFKLDLTRLIRSKKVTRQHSEALRDQSVEDDINEVTSLRETVTTKKGEIAAIERAFLPVAETMQRLEPGLSKLYAAGAPDLRDVARAMNDGDGTYRFGKVKWPQAYVGNDRFLNDGFGLLVWLFRDEIRKRLEAEVKALTKEKKIIPVSERPARIKKLRQEILKFEYREGALTARIHAAGRTDIHHRHDIDIRALLQIATGTRSK